MLTKYVTVPITTVYTIKESMGITGVSWFVLSGTCQVLSQTDIPAPVLALNNQPKGPITYPTSASGTISSVRDNAPLDGITITPSGGVTNLILLC